MALVTRRLLTLRECWLRTAARSTAGSAGCLLSLNRGFITTSTQHQRVPFSSTQHQRVPFSSTQHQRVPFSSTQHQRVPFSSTQHQRVPFSSTQHQRVPFSSTQHQRVLSSSTQLQRGFSPASTLQLQRGFSPASTLQLQRGFSPASTLQLQRGFTTSTQPLRSDNKVTVNFINRDGEKVTVKGSPGDSLLDIVIEQDLDFDGFGACEGTLACSTCHLIFDEEIYKQLGPVTDEELDMLDLAYGLTDTSRLGCQICLTKSLDGMVARVPESVADIRQSGDGSS